MAGRIVGGDQAKGRTAARREAVDKSVQRHVGIAVDADAYRLAGADMLELRLLEIRDHIKNGVGNDIEQRGAGRHEPADAHLEIGADASDRRPNARIVKNDLRELPRKLRLREHCQPATLRVGYECGSKCSTRWLTYNC